jgi:hypothetical protein
MKTFNIHQFPNFIAEWRKSSMRFASEYIQKEEFSSINYSDDKKVWELSDEDYTMFVLRWR